MSDIHALLAAGCEGTIVGKAFYEGTLDLAAAFEAANAS
jgi:phosphoribosylformimino-5-aminoimidazole carboxamide ribotide isomerase